MHTVAVLLLTIFLSNGDQVASATVLPDADVDMCRRIVTPTVATVYKNAKPHVINGETVRITYVEGYCHAVTEGQHV